MDEHRRFLADRLLSEEQPITYRLLSRALDVHVNTAKEMLFDFHQFQNGKKASSIHATYLLCGAKPEEKTTQNGDNTEMTSSMPESEAAEEIPTTTLSLVREEDLENVLSTYSTVSSIHVYSLAPHHQKDLSLLSDITKSISEYNSKEDPLISAKKYGTIINPKVKRRGRKVNLNTAPPASGTPVPPKANGPVIKQETPKISSAVPVKQEPVKDAPSSSATKAPPPLKKTGSGGIMQSFAKAAARPRKPKAEPKKEEDHMALSDDGEADESDLPVKKETQESEAARKTRKEREAELRRMMEASDDEDDEEEKPDEEMEEEAPEPEPEAEAETEDLKKEEPAEMVSSKGDGRRRGRRRVTKKRRIQDEEGYMVTIQEQGWESFSEEDTAPTATSTSTPASSAGAAAKGKKTAGKPAQGNIMSFFSKK